MHQATPSGTHCVETHFTEQTGVVVMLRIFIPKVPGSYLGQVTAYQN
jgi:hypothetical protein